MEPASGAALRLVIRDPNKLTVHGDKQAEFACTWNAFVLQTLGNAFLDADYRDNPATVGFVPPITADQVLRFYSPVV